MAFDPKAYQREYYQQNKDRINARNKKYARDNRDKLNSAAKKWKAENPEKYKAIQTRYLGTHPGARRDIQWRANLKKAYGITPEQYEALNSAQAGLCQICKQACPSGRRLAIDHCHETKKVRGLLCCNCNQGIGHFQESVDRLQSAIRYVQERCATLKKEEKD